MTASDRQASIEVDEAACCSLGLDLAQPRDHRLLGVKTATVDRFENGQG